MPPLGKKVHREIWHSPKLQRAHSLIVILIHRWISALRRLQCNEQADVRAQGQCGQPSLEFGGSGGRLVKKDFPKEVTHELSLKG